MSVWNRKKNFTTNVINITDSVDKAEILLGLCEGEIEGLENGEKSLYINDTPLQNAAGGDNFSDFNVQIYTGSHNDGDVSFMLTGSTDPTNVGQTLAYNTPVVRSGEKTNIDYISLRLVIQQLMRVTDDGTEGNSVQVKIEYQATSEGNTWHSLTQDGNPYTLVGKVTSSTVLQFKIKVPKISEPYILRVTKMSQDGDNEKNFNNVQFESFQESYTDKKSFPNTALAHIYMQYSDQLSSVPSVSGVYKLLRIRVPSNYNPETHTYSGEWNGTFKIAWSDNPAWCLYDFVMNDRYGINAYSPVILDKWDCYEAGQWCDQMVSDGKGGQEPRYTCNLLQTEATNGREFVSYLAGLFNAFLVEPSTGYLRLFIDKDADAVFLFTPENVTEDGFSYSFTSPENRYNDIKVSFTNPALNWEADTRRVYNAEDIEKNGRVTLDFAAVGCIREGEAMRRAYLKLISSITEKMSVTFTTNRQAQYLSNFDIILIADPVLGYSLPGRIKSISSDRKTIYLRDSIYLEAGIPYKIKFNLPDQIWETDISPLSLTGSTKSFIVEDRLPDNLPELAAFTIYGSENSGTPKPFRITSITENEGNPDNYTITALEINRNKWDAADNFEFADMIEYSGLKSMADIPHILGASFYTGYDRVNLQNEVNITPELDESYPYYSGRIIVYSREVGTDVWIQREVTGKNVIKGHPSGNYEFIILPVSTTGITPSFDTAPHFPYIVPEVNLYPGNIDNLQAERSVNGVTLTWDPVSDVDLAGYEIREGEDWDSATVIVTDLAANSFYISITDSTTKHYMVAAKNYSGNYSPYPAFISTNVTKPGDVPNFYATVSTDRIRFDWTQVDGTDIEYEIRQGDNWGTALKVASVKGNNTTVLLPSIPEITYCIKAKSLAGLYSENPRYTQPDMLLNPNRNIILTEDNGNQGFPGVTYGFEELKFYNEDTGTYVTVPNALVMSQEVTRAEHYFPIHLDKKTRARNWLETEPFANITRMTWVDLHYRWSQAEAHTSWIGSHALDSEGDIELVIMKHIGIAYGGLLGFSYNETLKDIFEEYTPTSSSGIAYDNAHIVKGLVLSNNTKVSYENINNLPEVFHVTFKLRVDNTTSENLNLISLTDGNRKYLKIFICNGKVYCRGSDYNDLVVDYKHNKTLDFLTIGVSQSASERSLYFYADYANFESSETIQAEPIGKFTKYYINKAVGEYL